MVSVCTDALIGSLQAIKVGSTLLCWDCNTAHLCRRRVALRRLCPRLRGRRRRRTELHLLPERDARRALYIGLGRQLEVVTPRIVGREYRYTIDRQLDEGLSARELGHS